MISIQLVHKEIEDLNDCEITHKIIQVKGSDIHTMACRHNDMLYMNSLVVGGLTRNEYVFFKEKKLGTFLKTMLIKRTTINEEVDLPDYTIVLSLWPKGLFLNQSIHLSVAHNLGAHILINSSPKFIQANKLMESILVSESKLIILENKNESPIF